MALSTYIYQLTTGANLVAEIVSSLDPGTAAPAVISAASTPEVLLRYEASKKADLDAAMGAAGWEYVGVVP